MVIQVSIAVDNFGGVGVEEGKVSLSPLWRGPNSGLYRKPYRLDQTVAYLLISQGVASLCRPLTIGSSPQGDSHLLSLRHPRVVKLPDSLRPSLSLYGGRPGGSGNLHPSAGDNPSHPLLAEVGDPHTLEIGVTSRRLLQYPKIVGWVD